jgi:hypothetical protein
VSFLGEILHKIRSGFTHNWLKIGFYWMVNWWLSVHSGSYNLWLHHPHGPILQVSTFHSIWNHNWVGVYCLNVILTKFLNLALGSNFWVIVEHLCETWQKHLSCTKILLHVIHIIRTRWMFSRVDYLHVPYIGNKIDQVCFLLCVFWSPVRLSWSRRWLTP